MVSEPLDVLWMVYREIVLILVLVEDGLGDSGEKIYVPMATQS